MRMPIKYLVMAACLLTAAACLHGSYPLTFALDTALIAVTLPLLAWLDPRCFEVELREATKRTKQPTQAVRHRWVETRVKSSALAVVVIYCVFLSQYGTVEGLFHHRQRLSMITHVERLVAADQYQEAAKYLEECLRHRLPADTKAALQLKLLECWLAMSESGSASVRAQILARAEALAAEGIVDRAIVANLQRHINRIGRIAAHQTNLEQAKRSAAESLAGERNLRRAAESLAAERHQQLDAQAVESAGQIAALNREAAARHFSLLLAWGDSLPADLLAQRSKYQEAIDFGRRWQFDIQSADTRLQAVIAAIRSQQPETWKSELQPSGYRYAPTAFRRRSTLRSLCLMPGANRLTG